MAFKCLVSTHNVQGSPGTKDTLFPAARPQSAPCATYCYSVNQRDIAITGVGLTHACVFLCAFYYVWIIHCHDTLIKSVLIARHFLISNLPSPVLRILETFEYSDSTQTMKWHELGHAKRTTATAQAIYK